MNNITLKSEWGYSNTLLPPGRGGIDLVMLSFRERGRVQVSGKLVLVMFLPVGPSRVTYKIYGVSGTQQKLSELCRKHIAPLFQCFPYVQRYLVKTA